MKQIYLFSYYPVIYVVYISRFYINVVVSLVIDIDLACSTLSSLLV